MIINRIKDFLDIKNLSVFKFEKTIGTSDGTIRNAIKKGNEINSKWLVIICDNYPELNPNWLITGIGEMFKPPNKELPKVSNSVFTPLEKDLHEKDLKIKNLEESMIKLKNDFENLKREFLNK